MPGTARRRSRSHIPGGHHSLFTSVFTYAAPTAWHLVRQIRRQIRGHDGNNRGLETASVSPCSLPSCSLVRAAGGSTVASGGGLAPCYVRGSMPLYSRTDAPVCARASVRGRQRVHEGRRCHSVGWQGAEVAVQRVAVGAVVRALVVGVGVRHRGGVVASVDAPEGGLIGL